MRSFTIIPKLETYPKVVAFSQTVLGKLCLVLVFNLLLGFASIQFRHEITFGLLIFSFLPLKDKRKGLLVFGLIMVLYFHADLIRVPSTNIYLETSKAGFANRTILTDFAQKAKLSENRYILTGVSISLILFSLLVHFCIRSSPIKIITRWPLASLFTIDVLMICAVSAVPREHPWLDFMWIWIVLFNTAYVWYTAYGLLHARHLEHESVAMRIGPGIWWGFPFGKSNAFLAGIEAKDSHSHAIVKLKAIKLLAWVVIVRQAQALIGPAVDLPGFDFSQTLFEGIKTQNLLTQMRFFMEGRPAPINEMWRAVLVTFFYDMLMWTTRLNTAVAVIRFFGFNLPRGVYKPFYAKSMPEFFARRYYYYKEMIFDFFVLPAIVRLSFIKNKKVRFLIAVWLAVGMGTFFTHLLTEVGYLKTYTIGQYLYHYSPFFWRCTVFGLIIGLYQFGNPLPVLGTRNPRTRHAANLLFIILFFALSKLFSPMMLTGNPKDTYGFFLRLFGLN